MSKFVRISRQVGNYIINKPSTTITEIRVKIPEYEFEGKFSYTGEKLYGIKNMPWDDALYEIISDDCRFGEGRRHQEELKEIIDEHHDEIHEEWLKYRLGYLKERRDKIETEIQEIEVEL